MHGLASFVRRAVRLAGSLAVAACVGGTVACSGKTGDPVLFAPKPPDAGRVTELFDGGFANADGAALGCGCVVTTPVHSDKLDLLFVVDNSSSMQEEQSALRREFPRMITKLITGDHDNDGKPDHQPIVDLHLAVVSSDMGASTDVCTALGDDGRFRHEPNPAGDAALSCKKSYPTFLKYEGGLPPMAQLAQDFSCVAALGTQGCGFEHHLESALKALWPASDPSLQFVGLGGASSLGRGDTDNAGFLRAHVQNAATLAIVVVADEDDCSSYDRNIFRFQATSDANDPLADRPVNLRCFDYADRLQPLERYVYGFRHLGSARVVFAAIVGVPVDLVDPSARKAVDFRNRAVRDAYYDEILSDPRMQQKLDPNDDTDLAPACRSKLGRASPARRFVSLAKRFGEDSLIQSICDADFGPPVDLIVEHVTVPVE